MAIKIKYGNIIDFKNDNFIRIESNEKIFNTHADDYENKLITIHDFRFDAYYFTQTDDKSRLEYQLYDSLKLAKTKQWKTVSIVFNDLIDLGYPSVIALKILTNLSNAVIKRIKNIDIEIILPPIGNDDFVSGENNTNEGLFSTINKNLSYFDEDRFVYDDEFFNGEKPINTFFPASDFGECLQFTVLYAPSDRLNFDAAYILSFPHIDAVINVNELPFNSVADYIDAYIEKRFKDEKWNKIVRRFLNKALSNNSKNGAALRAKHYKVEKRDTISKQVLMRYILALHMSMSEAENFLLFCGRCFSPISKEDQLYKYLISNKKYVSDSDDVSVINAFCLEKNVNLVFDF